MKIGSVWFEEIPLVLYCTVLYCTYTPDGVHAKRMRKKMNEVMTGKAGGMRIVERVGVSVISMMKRTDPFKESTCGRVDCLTCKQDKCGDFEKECVGYEVWCVTCEEKGIEKVCKT